jgi:signal transduction histidine kinase
VSGAGAALLLSAFVASYESNLGHRPFEYLTPIGSLIAVQIYLSVMSLPIMSVAGLLEERRQIANDLGNRLQFEALLSSMAGSFVHVPGDAKPSAFDEGLRRIGEFFRADYVGLLERAGGDGPLDVTRKWTPGRSPLEGVNCVQAFPRVFERTLAGETVVIESIDSLPAAAVDDRAAFRSLGLESAVALPLVSSDRVLGVLSVVTVHQRIWDAEDMAQLRLVAEVLANACARRRAEIEVQQTRQELAHLTRLSSMGELTASLAHQLNQPLTGILNNAEAARRFLDSGRISVDELRDIVSDIIEDDQRAGDVIRRVREMLTRTARPPARLDANVLVRDVASLVASDAVMKNVSVSFDIATRPLVITGQRTDLEQVLLNVLTNAMEAVAELPVGARRVNVQTAFDGSGHVLIVVRDFGRGFEAGSEHRIFEPFFTHKATGMGMGLTVARTLVDQHRGTIKAANHPGGGAVVTVAIPVAVESAA